MVAQRSVMRTAAMTFLVNGGDRSDWRRLTAHGLQWRVSAAFSVVLSSPAPCWGSGWSGLWPRHCAARPLGLSASPPILSPILRHHRRIPPLPHDTRGHRRRVWGATPSVAARSTRDRACWLACRCWRRHGTVGPDPRCLVLFPLGLIGSIPTFPYVGVTRPRIQSMRLAPARCCLATDTVRSRPWPDPDDCKQCLCPLPYHAFLVERVTEFASARGAWQICVHARQDGIRTPARVRS